MDFTDDKLIELARENDDNAKDLLFQKYKYIIDTEIHKYLNISRKFGIDYNELHQEADVGFSDALVSYRIDKEMALPSFITLCVDRRIRTFIRRFTTNKNKIMNETLSLEYIYDKTSSPLSELISDNNENNPLDNMVKEEHLKELTDNIYKALSNSEKEVYDLMISGLKYDEIAIVLNKNLKQVDNAIQRIKIKISKILEKM
jgi:RNA polymerase sporulation-specific sigma factor